MLVSNVWLDPVFVAGAIGLPLALSSNMGLKVYHAYLSALGINNGTCFNNLGVFETWIYVDLSFAEW